MEGPASTERWENDIKWGTPKYLEWLFYQCHFVHHRYGMEWPGIESGHARLEAGDWLVAWYCVRIEFRDNLEISVIITYLFDVAESLRS